MNKFKKIYCRTFQTAFKIAIPFLPYRKPKKLDSINDLPQLFMEKDMDAGELRLLVSTAAYKAGRACAAFCEDGRGAYSFVATYGGQDFDAWRASLTEALQAHGGGKAPFLQGKANCTEQEIRRFFAD